MGEISLERCNLFKQYASIESSSTPFPGIHHALAKERKVSNTKIGWGGGCCQGQKIFSPRPGYVVFQPKNTFGRDIQNPICSKFSKITSK